MGSQPLHGKTTYLPSNSITTSVRMKIAVLFSLVVLLFAAFLKPASGCPCATFIKKAKLAPNLLKNLNIKVDAEIMKKGPVAICKGLPKDAIDTIAGQPC